MDWLYLQTIVVNGSALDPIAQTDAVLLGDRLMAPAFTNAMQARIIEEYTSKRKAPSFAVVNCAYSKLSANKPLLRMFVDTFVYYHVESRTSTPPCREELALPHQFLLAIMHRHAQNKSHAWARPHAADYR